jgi:hypothetical protein
LIDITPACLFFVEEVLPPSTYVDVDELYHIVAFETIDVEKPAQFSKQYYYKYSKSFG